MARLFLVADLALLVGCATSKQPQAAPPTEVSGPKLTPEEKEQRIEQLLALTARTRADLYALNPQQRRARDWLSGTRIFG
jgi:uncharacterized lipoprotein YajG